MNDLQALTALDQCVAACHLTREGRTHAETALRHVVSRLQPVPGSAPETPATPAAKKPASKKGPRS
jgi:hypothetical protein